MTYEELKALCLKHNAEYKAALVEIVTAEYVTEAMKARIEAFREKDKYLSDLHGHFQLERLQAQADELSAMDLFDSLRAHKKTELS